MPSDITPECRTTIACRVLTTIFRFHCAQVLHSNSGIKKTGTLLRHLEKTVWRWEISPPSDTSASFFIFKNSIIFTYSIHLRLWDAPGHCISFWKNSDKNAVSSQASEQFDFFRRQREALGRCLVDSERRGQWNDWRVGEDGKGEWSGMARRLDKIWMARRRTGSVGHGAEWFVGKPWGGGELGTTSFGYMRWGL